MPNRLLTRQSIVVVCAAWTAIGLLFGAQQAMTADGIGAADALRVLVFNALWAMVSLALIAGMRYWRGLRSTRVIAAIALAGLVIAPSVLLVTEGVLWLSGLSDWSRLVGALAANIATALAIYITAFGAVLLAEQQRARTIERQQRTDAERALAETRTALLRSQLQPHFLFNALNTIAGLIDDEPRVAETMTIRLADLLRLMLDEKRGALVPLGDELEVIDAYLAIEQIRFGTRLRVEHSIDPRAVGVAVPDLFLQPLIENAIRHGLASRGQGGTISITARRVDQTLHIRVGDNGLGADPASIEEGIGLRNTRERLMTLLPGSTFEIEASPAGGFAVVATLPVRP